MLRFYEKIRASTALIFIKTIYILLSEALTSSALTDKRKMQYLHTTESRLSHFQILIHKGIGAKLSDKLFGKQNVLSA